MSSSSPIINAIINVKPSAPVEATVLISNMGIEIKRSLVSGIPSSSEDAWAFLTISSV